MERCLMSSNNQINSTLNPDLQYFSRTHKDLAICTQLSYFMEDSRAFTPAVQIAQAIFINNH